MELARHHLTDAQVKVAAVVGFPLGAMDADAKRYETEVAIDLAAQEIEVVMNHGCLKDGEARFILRELRDVVEAADERPVTVILEAGWLTQEEIRLACELILESGAKCVQAGTGQGASAATATEVRLLREAVGERFPVKAAGSIRDLAEARAFLDAGATRLGTPEGLALAESLIAADAGSN